jgi:hypothetical protein
MFDAAFGPLAAAEAGMAQQAEQMASMEERVPAAIMADWRRMWLATYWSQQRFGFGDLQGAIAARQRARALNESLLARAPSRDRHAELAITMSVLASWPEGGVAWSEVVETWRELERRWGGLDPTEQQLLDDAIRRAGQ